MTNTESRSGVGFDKPASWDDPELEHDEHDEQHITEADARELAVYGFDSEQRTLVGIGPTERARRSRKAAEIPQSERAPQSESPGPFIADDDIPPSLRGRKLGPWAVVALAFALVAVALLLGVSALAPSARHTAAVTPPGTAVAAQPPPPPAEVAPPPAEVAPPSAEVEVARPSAEVATKVERTNVTEPTVSSDHARVAAAVPALPVTLADVPRPSTVDLSSADDRSAGSIDVTSSPPANVVLDGRPVGKAPRVVRVPAGVHTLVFIHPLYGRKKVVVNVIPGVTARASATF